ncbi:MAG: hypothetical protein Unbinned4162contig1001_4 [Prokaryotic dsDNA virus sp.]|nr:MAG: hypothetical protein Unbinned4162contig1001_4 [Prokaryotic dsDNA virus sp.]|tara:strand:+ start:27180 stop:27356 length:177 start_codon:yes stop_codon:yes gene_type:complete
MLVQCVGGPYDKKLMNLNSPHSGTLRMRVKEFVGRYVWSTGETGASLPKIEWVQEWTS